ncbi:thiamine-phosphate kinase [Mycetocola tolaasinivorans]|uniref:Thiamine-monophosphate kinase n=1 Tax=Mycetocola tolaasinivorans TaxID=76635 RepID=A0A3L7A9P4_9MICO|nr:thiamine-phosphate kinase [Mycetocola tolaasinivorans]RLP76578.1 thiamine-phosphate kinase [Mycetocola tolaasinivorans]
MSETPAAETPRLVRDASESEILDRILPRYAAAATAEVGPGDDAAVMRQQGERYVVTTDMMIHGPDFRWAWHTPFELGWKAAVTNLADVYAMGARPTGLVVAIAATADLPLTALEELADGLSAACAELAPGCAVVGGDLSVSDTFTLAITAFGDLEDRAAVLRSGARPGDVIALAGDAGRAAHGLDLLFAEGVDAQGTPDAAATAALRAREPELIAAQLAPRPPLPAGIDAARAGATAMMDVSDGLALDASRIARASGVSLNLFSGAFTAEPNLERAIRGGEDHALLATFPAGAALPAPFRAIGVVGEGSGVLCDGVPLDGKLGWDPYTAWDGQRG